MVYDPSRDQGAHRRGASAKGDRGRQWTALSFPGTLPSARLILHRSSMKDGSHGLIRQIIDTRSPPATATHVWISEVREILAQERPDVIWSQSDWSARGLNSLGIPIICTIQDRCASASVSRKYMLTIECTQREGQRAAVAWNGSGKATIPLHLSRPDDAMDQRRHRGTAEHLPLVTHDLSFRPAVRSMLTRARVMVDCEGRERPITSSSSVRRRNASTSSTSPDDGVGARASTSCWNSPSAIPISSSAPTAAPTYIPSPSFRFPSPWSGHG